MKVYIIEYGVADVYEETFVDVFHKLDDAIEHARRQLKLDLDEGNTISIRYASGFTFILEKDQCGREIAWYRITRHDVK